MFVYVISLSSITGPVVREILETKIFVTFIKRFVVAKAKFKATFLSSFASDCHSNEYKKRLNEESIKNKTKIVKEEIKKRVAQESFQQKTKKKKDQTTTEPKTCSQKNLKS